MEKRFKKLEAELAEATLAAAVEESKQAESPKKVQLQVDGEQQVR